MLLENNVALITGAGNGIGRATAVRFAQEGAKVVVADEVGFVVSSAERYKAIPYTVSPAVVAAEDAGTVTLLNILCMYKVELIICLLYQERC